MLQKMAKNGNNCRLAVLAEEGKMIAAAGGSQFKAVALSLVHDARRRERP